MERAIDIDSDAFGHALLDHLDGSAVHELIERSDGYIAVSAGIETYFAEPSDQEREVVALAEGRVLDVGCGAGRYALTRDQTDYGVFRKIVAEFLRPGQEM